MQLPHSTGTKMSQAVPYPDSVFYEYPLWRILDDLENEQIGVNTIAYALHCVGYFGRRRSDGSEYIRSHAGFKKLYQACLANAGSFKAQEVECICRGLGNGQCSTRTFIDAVFKATRKKLLTDAATAEFLDSVDTLLFLCNDAKTETGPVVALLLEFLQPPKIALLTWKQVSMTSKVLETEKPAISPQFLQLLALQAAQTCSDDGNLEELVTVSCALSQLGLKSSHNFLKIGSKVLPHLSKIEAVDQVRVFHAYSAMEEKEWKEKMPEFVAGVEATLKHFTPDMLVRWESVFWGSHNPRLFYKASFFFCR